MHDVISFTDEMCQGETHLRTHEGKGVDDQPKITLGPKVVWGVVVTCSWTMSGQVSNAKYGTEHHSHSLVNNDMQYQNKPHYVYFLIIVPIKTIFPVIVRLGEAKRI
jgi:hypothetical protein